MQKNLLTPGGCARHVGRVGALAIALGVGMAIASAAGAGTAGAEADDTSAGTASSPSAGSRATDSQPSTSRRSERSERDESPDRGDADRDADRGDSGEDGNVRASDDERDTTPAPRGRRTGTVSGVDGDADAEPDTDRFAARSESISVATDSASPRKVARAVSKPADPVPPAAPPAPADLASVVYGFFRDVQRTFFNRAPDARDQQVSVDLDAVGDVSAAVPLWARDRDDDVLRFSVVGAPSHGVVTFDQATGTFTYDPDDAFARSGGTDTFTYKVSDASAGWHLPDLVSLLTKPDYGHADVATVTITVAPTLVSGIDLSGIDATVRPQDDFFGWLHGKWLAEHEIPADRPISDNFRVVYDRLNLQLRDLITELSEAGAAPGTDAQRIGDFYASFMDTDRIAEVGLRPLLEELAVIEGAADADALAVVLGTMARKGVVGGFNADIGADAKNSTRYLLHLDQGGIGLPDESYYRDPQYADILAAYPGQIAAMFALVYGGSADDHAETARRIVAIETKLAAAHWDTVKSRDGDLTYNVRDLAALAAEAPGFDWDGWFEGYGVSATQAPEFVVGQPDYFTAFADAWSDESLQDWKAWTSWRLIKNRAALLTEDIVEQDFAFTGRVLAGTEQNRPRWQRALRAIDEKLGHALGRLYVERHFPPEAKQRVQTMVDGLVVAYRDSISAVDWMTPQSQQKALEKLDKMTAQIGYPEQWVDYSGLAIDSDDLYGNYVRATEVATARNLAKLGTPVDRGEWHMTPQTVNAYYNPRTNTIAFPAAFLQAPFFDADADDAANYGAIGAIIGHEIGHAFDDQGSRYDGDGNLVDWWTPADRAAFAELSKMLIDQYDQYTPRQLPDGPHVNGAFTVGENMADLSGLSIALVAYRNSLGGAQAPVIDGFTGVQRVFLGWGQAWQAKYRDAFMIQTLATDPHSPEEFRVNGVLRNIDAFYEAFGVTETDAMYLPPALRVHIWA